ncbi:hypothetical protein D4764_02G0003240 [Takifugu flavidus]|uniref:Integrase zinc-binding domain-containing protein n=1 Tax=Takifugu flavidus TaxID=433684 RepID=A0A5C6NJ84_9TELE|nr:hypothetical protein D4764_02G0003240 [Takifugu flavidus]
MAEQRVASEDLPKTTRRRRPPAYLQDFEVMLPPSLVETQTINANPEWLQQSSPPVDTTWTMRQPEPVFGHQMGSTTQGVGQRRPPPPEQLPKTVKGDKSSPSDSQDEYEVEQHSGSSGSSMPESPHPTRDHGHRYIALHQSSTTSSAVNQPAFTPPVLQVSTGANGYPSSSDYLPPVPHQYGSISQQPSTLQLPQQYHPYQHQPQPTASAFPIYPGYPSTPQAPPFVHQPPTQPVPVPRLPKLEHDSEREFTDLKMALDYLLGPHPQLSEYYKYRVLMEQLVLEEARLIAQSCRHHAQPYSAAMQALQQQYGQPHQLAQSEIAALLNSPDVRSGDTKSFQNFALQVQLLVGMLISIEGPNGRELMSSGHVDRLLSKLPRFLRDSFVEYLHTQGRLHMNSLNPYSLQDLSEWLKGKAEVQRLSDKMAQRHQRKESSRMKRETIKPRNNPVAVYHGWEQGSTLSISQPEKKETRDKRICLFCKGADHYLSQCPRIATCTPEQVERWITEGKRCRRCGRSNHGMESCTLKKACSECQEVHLKVLHVIANPSSKVYLTTPTVGTTLIPAKQSSKVYLKVVPVIVSHGNKTLHIYAILDDGAERTIILPAAVHYLGLSGEAESMALRTIRHDVAHLSGSSVDFHISSATKPEVKHKVQGAFTAGRLSLTEQSYPVAALQKRYDHLRGLPIQSFDKVYPLLLIGADNTGLIAVKEQVRLGLRGGPAAVNTELGWALQGPDGLTPHQVQTQALYFTNVQSLTMTYTASEKLVVRSRQDQEAIKTLESGTVRVKVGDTRRYATPLPCKKDAPPLRATMEAVMASLRSIERRLKRDPVKAQIYEDEIKKLIHAGCVAKLHPNEVRLLPEDQPLLRFIWQNLRQDEPPDVTTCATFAMQKHVKDYKRGSEEILQSLEQSFYVDNCLQSLPTVTSARWLVDKLRQVLQEGGFEIRQAYFPPELSCQAEAYNLHVFCDASEQAYGSVAYLTTESLDHKHVSFVMARSRVAPKRQISMPRLELCAALAGAQLAALILKELTVSISSTSLWMDSTMVLNWLRSESCRFKVFVGTRVSEIQELTQNHEWRYVDSPSNPADDVTRGKTVAELILPNRWIEGPVFLRQSSKHWPSASMNMEKEGTEELKRSTFCGLTRTAEVITTSEATDSFPDEVKALRKGKQVSCNSRLSCLSPEWDLATELIRVGGRFRRMEEPHPVDIHPIVLEPHHKWVKLLIREVGNQLLHPGSDRVFAELRRQYWVLRGRQAVKHIQRTCTECKKWRGKPTVPLMADLPAARLFNPPASPHFGGIWERKISSVKRALQVVIGAQAVPEDVLLTVLIEVEGILNAKPLGCPMSQMPSPEEDGDKAR